MYGDRINELDFGVAKTLKYGRSRTRVAIDFYNAAELERGIDLQQRLRPRRHVVATVDGPDAALFQDHCGDRTVTIRSRYWSFSHVMLVLAVVLCELAPASFAWAADEHKRILVLYSTRRDAEFSIVGEDVLPKILDVGLGRDLDYYSEFIDVTRFPDPSYRVAFGDFIRLKYQGVAFDLVIAMGDVAAAFVDTDRVRLFQSPGRVPGEQSRHSNRRQLEWIHSRT